MSNDPILAKITADGGQATIHIEAVNGGLALVARLNGQAISGHLSGLSTPAGLPAGYVAAIGRLALTRTEAQTVAAAYRQARAARPVSLRQQRDLLVDALRGAQEDRQHGVGVAWDRFDGSGNPFAQVGELDLRVDDAQAKLAAFDRAHPECAQAELEAALNRALTD